MTTQSFANGALRVAYPDAFDPPNELHHVAADPKDADPRTLADDDPAALIAGLLGERQFALVRSLELAPTPALGATASPESATWTVDLDLAADEYAAILLDHDGVVSWQLPTRRTESDDPPARSRADVARSTVTFELTVGDDAATGGELSDATGGLIPAVGRLRAHVLTFVANAVAGEVLTFLERDLQRGLVVITSPDPKRWELVPTLAEVNLPYLRVVRILLLVHGTFSSTLGSFAGLAATPEGREFLEGAISSYDAVIGFDHPTLSCDPMQNATDLLTCLQSAQFLVYPTIDVVCHGRGGLVARSLIEYLLPSAEWRANTDRVVFIGAPNGGTAMVEPPHRREFVDLYTNLAMASTRAIGLVEGSLPIADIARGVLDGVGAFVKYLVAYSLDGAAVPGLAAMEPGGEFVRQINQNQPGQPGPGTPWFVISSDFQPQLVSDNDTLRELPVRLVKELVDRQAGQPIGAPNDVVVDVKSMSSIDAEAGGFVADSLAFGANGCVHHWAYVVQPEVVRALTDWLLGQRGSGVVPPGSLVRANLPRAAQRNIIVLDHDAIASDVRRRLDPDTTWVVLRNTGGSFAPRGEYYGSSRSYINYPVNREMISTRLQDVPDTTSLYDAINFDDLQGSPTIDIGDPMPEPTTAAAGAAAPDTVVVDGGEPIAVIPPPPAPMSLDVLADRPYPRAGPETPAADHTVDALPVPVQGDRAQHAAVVAHLTAQMANRVTLNATVSVSCRLSRDSIVVEPGEKHAFTKVDPECDIVIQLIPMLNAKILGAGRVSLPIPKPGVVTPISFEFKPTQLGSCEVWVVAQQAELPLMSLILKAAVEKQLSSEPATQPAEASVPVALPATESERFQRLAVYLTEDGDKIKFLCDMFDEPLKIAAHGVSPGELGDRKTYVKGLFAQIEGARLANQGNVDNFVEKLRDIGIGLFQALFPENLQKELWKHRNELKRLAIWSNDPFIPWEIVHLQNPDAPGKPKARLFLGELGLVRWLDLRGVGFPPTTLRRRPGRVRSLCAKYGDPNTHTLAEIEKEEQFLTKKLGATPVDPPTDPALRVMLSKGDFDIFHFAGHGLAKQDGFKESVIELGDVEDTPRHYQPIEFSDASVKAEAVLNKERSGGPLVFLNACQVGQSSIELGIMGGFAPAFLGKGAGAFVSTLWSVRDGLARTFGEEFYEQLLAGETVSTATRLARAKGRRSLDISWLAYVVYANPLARLEPP